MHAARIKGGPADQQQQPFGAQEVGGEEEAQQEGREEESGADATRRCLARELA